MTYTSILDAMHDDPGNERGSTSPRGWPARWGGSLVVIHVSPPPCHPDGLRRGCCLPVARGLRGAAGGGRPRQREDEGGVPAGLRPGQHAVARRHEEGDPGSIGHQAARGADLTVIGAQDGDRLDALAPSPINHLMLGAGGPVLVLPRVRAGAGARPSRGRGLERLARGRRAALRRA